MGPSAANGTGGEAGDTRVKGRGANTLSKVQLVSLGIPRAQCPRRFGVVPLPDGSAEEPVREPEVPHSQTHWLETRQECPDQ